MWLVVFINGFGGLLVAATMKYADNIVKCFATALAIISTTVLSVPIFGFVISYVFLAGAGCTVVATTLYAWAPLASAPQPESGSVLAGGASARSGLGEKQELLQMEGDCASPTSYSETEEHHEGGSPSTERAKS